MRLLGRVRARVRQMVEPAPTETIVEEPDVPVTLPPLTPLPRTRAELAATAPAHRRVIRRADDLLRVTRVLEDFRAMDGLLQREGD